MVKHTTCVTEHEKYAKGATKPGGYAAQGFHADGPAKPAREAEATGLEFLATRPPWKCTVCKVTCTSRETLEGHASGVKHRRRVRRWVVGCGRCSCCLELGRHEWGNMGSFCLAILEL